MRKTATEWKAYYSDPKFEQQYTYEGHDLGATCTEDGTSILLWSPVAETVNVRFFQDGETGTYRTGRQKKEKQGGSKPYFGQKKCSTVYTMILSS